MRLPNYDKYPSTKYEGFIEVGWESIRKVISSFDGVVAVDLYTGTYEDEIASALSDGFDEVVLTRDLMKPEEEVGAMTAPFMTDDVLFGHVTCLGIRDFFRAGALAESAARLKAPGSRVLVLGPGASLAAPEDALLV